MAASALFAGSSIRMQALVLVSGAMTGKLAHGNAGKNDKNPDQDVSPFLRR